MLFLLLIIFVGLAGLLAWFLISHDHGEKEPIAALWLAAGFGVAGALVAGALEGHIIAPVDLQPGAPLPSLFRAAMTVGFVEELCKFLPLALFIYGRRYFNEHTDGVIYFALAGIGFGLPENILYTLKYGTHTAMTRLLLTPIFHAAITGMVGYFLARQKLAGRAPYVVVVPLAMAIVLHGLYDFGLLSGSGLYIMLSLIITAGISTGLFVLFLQATEQDQDDGLSRVGNNSFCRSCGLANPRHHLYCIRCGNNA